MISILDFKNSLPKEIVNIMNKIDNLKELFNMAAEYQNKTFEQYYHPNM